MAETRIRPFSPALRTFRLAQKEKRDPRPAAAPQPTAVAQDRFDPSARRTDVNGYYPISAKQVTTAGTSDVHTPNSGAILDAPIQGDPRNPSADTYNRVIDQFDVETNPRYAQNHQGKGETYCNIFAWDVTRAMGAEIPHYVQSVESGIPSAGTDGQELDANATNDWLNQHGADYGWREVSAEEAQALANQGYPTVASWKNPGDIGHIAVVRPGELTDAGPEIAQAGGVNRNDTHVQDTFHGATPQYFVNDSGKPASAAPGAPGAPAPVSGDQLELTGDPKVGQMVKDAYHQYLRREGDVEGLQNWNAAAQGMKSGGASDEEIQSYLKDQFTNCPEAQALKLTDQAFRDVLGRDVSDSRGYWHEQAVTMMRDEGKSPEETQAFLEENLKNSDEYALNHPDAVVTSLYQQLLNRAPDATGMKTWTDLANTMKDQGASAGQIRDAISEKIKGSAEYQQLHANDTARANAPAALPKTGNEVIDHYAEAAIEAQRETGVPASLALAQLVQESGGSMDQLSGLARDHHNLFGVKGSGPAGSVSLPTAEYDANGNRYTTYADFARYHNDEESFVAHGELIAGTHPGWTPFYAEPWAQYQQDHDAYGLARGIASIYATDPGYADSLVRIMDQYDLTRFDALA